MRTYLIAALLACTAQTWAGNATINIDTTKRGPKLNPSMYGIFLEEINHGVDTDFAHSFPAYSLTVMRLQR